MIKLRSWEITLIGLVVVPILRKVLGGIKSYAEVTETSVDDTLVGLFEVIINVLDDGGIFKPQ